MTAGRAWGRHWKASGQGWGSEFLVENFEAHWRSQELIGDAHASADGGSAGEHSSNVMGDEDLGFPTLEPVWGHPAIVEY